MVVAVLMFNPITLWFRMLRSEPCAVILILLSLELKEPAESSACNRLGLSVVAYRFMLIRSPSLVWAIERLTLPSLVALRRMSALSLVVAMIPVPIMVLWLTVLSVMPRTVISSFLVF